MRIDHGTRAIVTGASRGIGRALAEALAARGATVGLASRSADELATLASSLGGRGVVLPCDVADAASVSAAFERFVAETGGLELAIANAGVAHYGRFEDQDPAVLERMTRINWLGTVHTARAALPALRGGGGGQLVIVSSGAGLRAFPEAAVYGATKAAQRAFAEALHHELAGSGVSVTTVFPGEFVTSLHDHEKATMPAWYHGDERAKPASELASAVLAGVEADRRRVAYPREVSLLALNAVAPGLVDRLLRRLRGDSAAPRR
jgi:3-oxoacyl-[acyl-carrier protein] reductase